MEGGLPSRRGLTSPPQTYPQASPAGSMAPPTHTYFSFRDLATVTAEVSEGGRALSGPAAATTSAAAWSGGLTAPPAASRERSYVEFELRSAGSPGRWRVGFGVTAEEASPLGLSAAYGADAWVYYCEDGSVWSYGRRVRSVAATGGGCAEGGRVGLLVDRGRCALCRVQSSPR